MSAGALLVPGRALGQQEVLRLRDGESHTAPAFAAIAQRTDLPITGMAAGWRPERTVGGLAKVRLDYAAPTPARRQKIIYNYGHSGGGITLSLGCAARVEKYIRGGPAGAPPRVRKDEKIVIVGAGVIGLAMAYVLKDEGYQRVEVVANREASGKFDDPKTVSDIAGGQFDAAGVAGVTGNIAPGDDLSGVLRETLTVLTKYRDRPGDPFRNVYVPVLNYTTDPGRIPPPLVTASAVVAGHASHLLDRIALPPNSVAGIAAPFLTLRESSVRFGVRGTILINAASLITAMKAYLRDTSGGKIAVPINAPATVARLTNGGPPLVRNLRDLATLDADVIVVCAGLGSALFAEGDEGARMFGRYGLLARLDKLSFRAGEPRYLYSGLGYMFPRSDGVIVGGAWPSNSAMFAIPSIEVGPVARPPETAARYLTSVRVGDSSDSARARDMVRTIVSMFVHDCGRVPQDLNRVQAWFNGYEKYKDTRMACRA